MLEDYARDRDPVPKNGLVVLGGEGRRFTVYDLTLPGKDSAFELVEYDIGPGRRFACFTDFLRSRLVELEQALTEARIPFGS